MNGTVFEPPLHETKIRTSVPLVADIQNFAQDVFDTVREPLLVLDAGLRVRSANSAFYQTFHVSAAETENQLIYELGNGQWDIAALRTLLEDIVPESTVFNDYELEHDFPHIGRRVMLLNARKLHDELVLLAMEDVTEKRRAQHLLEQIEAYAQDVVDTVREPLLILDSSLRVHSANGAFYQTFHVSSEETENQLIYELGNGQWDIPDLRTLLEDIVPTSSVFNDFELEHDFPVIGRRVMLLNARKLREGSHAELLVLAMEDVTERRRAEGEVATAKEAAERANRTKSLFLANMSHELRTPLNAISGYAQLIEMGLRGPVTEAQLLDLRRIQRSQKHLLGLINAVLNYAKLEAGSVVYALQTVVLDDVVIDAQALVDPQLHAKALSYHFTRVIGFAGSPESAPVHVTADPEKLRQILLNLLTNAMKFTARGGEIIVTRRTDGEMAVLSVRDTGLGIPAHKLQTIFDPFVQIGRGLTSGEAGVGLGLAISRDLALGMQGDLTVESVEGEGSIFTLTLPLASSDLSAEAV